MEHLLYQQWSFKFDAFISNMSATKKKYAVGSTTGVTYGVNMPDDIIILPASDLQGPGTPHIWSFENLNTVQLVMFLNKWKKQIQIWITSIEKFSSTSYTAPSKMNC